MFKVKVYYSDGADLVEEFDTLPKAKRFMHEECSWENTRYATIRNRADYRIASQRGDYHPNH